MKTYHCKGCGRSVDRLHCVSGRLCKKCYQVWWYSLPGHQERRREQNRRKYNRKKVGYQQRAMWTLWSIFGGYNQYARILSDLQKITDAAEDPMKWGFETRQNWRRILRSAGCRQAHDEGHKCLA